MPEVRPFAGITYRVPPGALAQVLAPPYDVITPEEQERLYARDPRNVVRVVLNRNPGEEAYADAAATFRRWLDEGVLAADEREALYVVEQQFDLEGVSRRRRGVLARFRAEDPGGSILPHEHTRQGPREDRYRLLQATRANFSPIFLMASDPSRALAGALAVAAEPPPHMEYRDDAGVVHRLWRVTEAAAIAACVEALARARAYIADGHHRYATALRWRDETGPQGAWTLGYFTPLDDPGLLVLPYHRVLAQGPSLEQAREALAPLFLLGQAADLRAAARAAAQSTLPYAFALADSGGRTLVAEARPEAEGLLPRSAPPALRALDTFFAHEALLPRLLGVPEEAVGFVHSLEHARAALQEGSARLALLLRPTSVRQIVDVSEAALSMPAKSTFFFPKLPSGLVIHPLPE
ncbi:MAG TPA: DUF1015 domain-containing protein [Vicinamibacteria bacterium]|nr:DUF1015 domain-containing protein [Vicinamibacteria bacterium]